MNRLVAAIFLKAVDDWADPVLRPDVKAFLYSDWGAQLAEMLDLDPEVLRTRLTTGDYESLTLRAVYR